MLVDVDAIVLGWGATGFCMGLMAWVARRTLKTKAPEKWTPREIDFALRLARHARVTAFMYGCRWYIRAYDKPAPHKRQGYEHVPLPMVLCGYFED